MTVPSTPKPERRFAQDILPWVIGGAALVLYLITLNRWVTLNSLTLVADLNGWMWQPLTSQPLLFLLTCPLRLLPAGWVPLVLNVFTAVCASLTLMTLARSVALLPHDRMEQQRLLVQDEHALLSFRGAWVPVVLAVVALGLQLTFWEHAIVGSAEMLTLLVFAYVIRCLLEYRLKEEQKWLDRATLLFGLAMATDWGIVGFLPLFLVALLRTKRFSLFSIRALRRMERTGWNKTGLALKTDLRFLFRIALLGVAGFSFILLLPLLQSLSPHSSVGFWQAAHTVMSSEKATLLTVSRLFLRSQREVTLLLMAASLLPIFLLSIRWGAFAGIANSERFDLASFILHVSHAFLLLICIWTAFDPPFSPRQTALHLGLPLLFLPLYYLTALSIGYYSGFFLLLFGAHALQLTSRRFITRRVLCRVVPVLIYLLAALAAAGLLMENVPAIRANRAPLLDQYAKLAASTLPPDGAVVLSDDATRLSLLQAELAREGKLRRYLPVDARSLPLATYRDWLSRKYPGRWPEFKPEANPGGAGSAAADTNAPLDATGRLQLVFRLTQSNRVYYLQPSPGPLLERYLLRPRGLLHEITPYPQDASLDLPLTTTEVKENQAFWQSAIETGVRPVLGLISQPELPRPAFQRRLMQKGHLQTPPPLQAKLLGWWYSGALNRWGVTLQRNGRWSEAKPYFTLAKEVNPDNIPARVNWLCNSNLLAHQPLTVVRTQFLPDQFSRSRTLNTVLTDDGPFDDPSYCYHLGLAFAEGSMAWQGCQQLERVTVLVPGDIAARLTFGDLCARSGRAGRALQTAAEIRAAPEFRPLSHTHEVDIAMLEASAWFTLTNRPVAQGIIYALLGMHPGDAYVSERAVGVFTEYKCYSDAFRITDRQLALNPNDAAALANKGKLFVLTGAYSNAIPPLTLSLSLTNIYGARFLRASAYLRLGRLDESEADYQELLREVPRAYAPYSGLGEIAERRKDTNAAIRYYEEYLDKVQPDTEEARTIEARVRSLRPSRR